MMCLLPACASIASQRVIKGKCICHSAEQVNVIRSGLNMLRSRDDLLVRLCRCSLVRNVTGPTTQYRHIDRYTFDV